MCWWLSVCYRVNNRFRYMFFGLLFSLEQANNLREVQAMKKLNPHPNIIQLHELIL